MKLLVTGATGFIGQACLRAALARGHEVAALLRPRSAPLTGVTAIPGDLAAPDWPAIEAFAPDACLHAAWISTPGEYLHSPLNRDFHDWSLTFLQGLTERGLRYSLVLGTCIEYAPQSQPLREDAPLGPATLYAQCKDALRRELESRGVDLGWARLFYPYGPGEDPRRLATSIIHRTLHREDIVLKTPDSTKDYIFIEDVAAALLTALEQRFRGVLNIGTGTGVTVREIAATIAQILGEPARIVVTEVVPDPYPCVVADPARLHLLGWRPRTSLADGLAQLVRYFAP